MYMNISISFPRTLAFKVVLLLGYLIKIHSRRGELTQKYHTVKSFFFFTEKVSNVLARVKICNNEYRASKPSRTRFKTNNDRLL